MAMTLVPKFAASSFHLSKPVNKIKSIHSLGLSTYLLIFARQKQWNNWSSCYLTISNLIGSTICVAYLILLCQEGMGLIKRLPKNLAISPNGNQILVKPVKSIEHRISVRIDEFELNMKTFE